VKSLQITNRKETSATIIWVEPSGTFASYVITLTPNGGGAVANPATPSKGTTTSYLQSLTPGTEYTISVKTRAGDTLSVDAIRTFTTSKFVRPVLTEVLYNCDPTPRNESLCAFGKSEKKGKVKKERCILSK
jgi:hypothetical protein